MQENLSCNLAVSLTKFFVVCCTRVHFSMPSGTLINPHARASELPPAVRAAVSFFLFVSVMG